MRLLFVIASMLAATAAAAAVGDEIDSEMKTVIGPRNVELANGAEALLLGRAEEGIRLTQLGLEKAQGPRERQAGYANLCAGYVMLREYETAIGYCDLALEINDRNWRALSNRALARVELGQYEAARADLDRGQAIAPNARSLKQVRGWLLDQTEPVAPTITIDDRREPPEDEDDENANDQDV
jgi:tetratricopeptide (TPR) repeat protein